LGGNYFQAKPELGINAASYGLCLKGNGKGAFRALFSRESGILIKGAVRDFKSVRAGNHKLLLVTKNNDWMEMFAY
jgi:hypothetical protein